MLIVLTVLPHWQDDTSGSRAQGEHRRLRLLATLRNRLNVQLDVAVAYISRTNRMAFGVGVHVLYRRTLRYALAITRLTVFHLCLPVICHLDCQHGQTS